MKIITTFRMGYRLIESESFVKRNTWDRIPASADQSRRRAEIAASLALLAPGNDERGLGGLV